MARTKDPWTPFKQVIRKGQVEAYLEGIRDRPIAEQRAQAAGLTYCQIKMEHHYKEKGKPLPFDCSVFAACYLLDSKKNNCAFAVSPGRCATRYCPYSGAVNEKLVERAHTSYKATHSTWMRIKKQKRKAKRRKCA